MIYRQQFRHSNVNNVGGWGGGFEVDREHGDRIKLLRKLG
jgi:hypothetical protein